jgi:hypothetical protein
MLKQAIHIAFSWGFNGEGLSYIQIQQFKISGLGLVQSSARLKLILQKGKLD